MTSKDVEIYFKEKVRELLNRVLKFEQKLISDHESIEKYRGEILANKTKEGNSYKDVKKQLVDIQKLHYYSFFLEQSYKFELVRTEELLTAAKVLNIDLDLNEEDSKAAENILKGQSRIFNVDSKGDVFMVDGPTKEQIDMGVNPRLEDENGLKQMYDNLLPAMQH